MINISMRIKLLIPVTLIFLVAAGFMYTYVRIDARIPMREVKFAKFQEDIQKIDCQWVDKETVLTIVRSSDEMERRYVRLFLITSIFLCALGSLNLVIVLGHLRNIEKQIDSHV